MSKIVDPDCRSSLSSNRPDKAALSKHTNAVISLHGLNSVELEEVIESEKVC